MASETRDLLGRSLALLTIGTDEDGEDDVWVHAGTVGTDNDQLVLLRTDGQPGMALRDEWLDRVQPVPADLQDALLDAEFFIPLNVARLPEVADTTDLELTELRQIEDD